MIGYVKVKGTFHFIISQTLWEFCFWKFFKCCETRSNIWKTMLHCKKYCWFNL